MTPRLRWLCVPLLCVLTVGLSGAALAADKTKVDQATRRIEHGARQLSEGDIGPGLQELFGGIGHTIVEGARLSANAIEEFFTKKPASPEPSREHE